MCLPTRGALDREGIPERAFGSVLGSEVGNPVYIVLLISRMGNSRFVSKLHTRLIPLLK